MSGCDGKYPSKRQAENACNEWELKGNKISFDREVEDWETWGVSGMKKGTIVSDEVKARGCRDEEETNQILGFENNSIKSGTWKYGDEMRGDIVKHFRY